MQAPHRYPVGVQVFEDVRTQGYVKVVDRALYFLAPDRPSRR